MTRTEFPDDSGWARPPRRRNPKPSDTTAVVPPNPLQDGSGIPAVLIHGRPDVGGPLDDVWQLAKEWPDAELKVVETGQAGGNTMTSCIVEATNRFARIDA